MNDASLFLRRPGLLITPRQERSDRAIAEGVALDLPCIPYIVNGTASEIGRPCLSPALRAGRWTGRSAPGAMRWVLVGRLEPGTRVPAVGRPHRLGASP